MDYTGFREFPFPSTLSDSDIRVKSFFLKLPDDEQLKLLNGSGSYEVFHDRVVHRMKQETAAL